MNEDLLKASDRFIEGIGHLATTVGVSRVIGQLYAMLFLSNKPLCLDDMVDRLRISKGNASVNIRELEKLGIVRKVWVKGSRKDFYEAELDFQRIVNTAVIGAVRRRAEVALATVVETENLVEKAQAAMNEEDSKTAELYLKKLQILRKFHGFVEGFLENISLTE